MSGKARLKRRRESLWKKDPRCYMCGVVTILPLDAAAKLGVDPGDLMRRIPDEMRDRLATIDHEVNRFDPMRRINEGRERTRLACWKCNSERGVEDYMSLPAETRRAMSTGEFQRSWGDGQVFGFTMKTVANIQDSGGHSADAGGDGGAVFGGP